MAKRVMGKIPGNIVWEDIIQKVKCYNLTLRIILRNGETFEGRFMSIENGILGVETLYLKKEHESGMVDREAHYFARMDDIASVYIGTTEDGQLDDLYE